MSVRVSDPKEAAERIVARLSRHVQDDLQISNSPRVTTREGRYKKEHVLGFFWVHYALTVVSRVRIRTTSNEVIVIRESGPHFEHLKLWAPALGLGLLAWAWLFISKISGNFEMGGLAASLFVMSIPTFLVGAACVSGSQTLGWRMFHRHHQDFQVLDDRLDQRLFELIEGEGGAKE